MPILIGEAIQRVQSIYSRGVQSKDTRLTPRHIYSCLCSSRSTILEQKANKNQYLSSWNYQTIPCVGLIEAPLHECPTAPDGVLFLRSEHKIPRPITSIDKVLISQISSLDNSIRFDFKEFDTFKYSKGKKFTANKAVYFFRNEYLYLGWIKLIKGVPLTGLFHDPLEAYNYKSSCNDCEDCCTPPFEREFPIDGELLNTVIQLAGQEAIELFKQMSADTTNDADDNSDVRSAMIHNPNDQ